MVSLIRPKVCEVSFMQVELMLNWCVLNQSFVKSLNAQMLVHFLKFMALIRTKDCAVFYIYVMTLICTKHCAVFL